MGAVKNSEHILEGIVCRPDLTKKPCLIRFQPKDYPTMTYLLIGVSTEDEEHLEAREVRVRGTIFPDAGVIRVSTIEVIERE